MNGLAGRRNLIKIVEKPAGFDKLMDEDHNGDWISSFADGDKSFFIDEPDSSKIFVLIPLIHT